MNPWITHPLQLIGEKVTLLPLEVNHFNELIALSTDPSIWTHMPVRGMEGAILRKALHEALAKRETGEQYPFVVIHNASGKMMGSTRFLHLNAEHRNHEIGYTWYLPEYWGKGYNEECKFLLL